MDFVEGEFMFCLLTSLVVFFITTFFMRFIWGVDFVLNLCFGSQSLSSTYLTFTYSPTPSDLWSRIESSNLFLGSHTIMTYGFRMDLGLRPEGSLTQFSVKVFLLPASCFLSLYFLMSPRQKVSRKKVEGKNTGPCIFQLPFIRVGRKAPTPAIGFKLWVRSDPLSPVEDF